MIALSRNLTIKAPSNRDVQIVDFDEKTAKTDI